MTHRTMSHPVQRSVVAILGGILCCLSAGSAFGQLPTAKLDSVFPPGGKVGTTVEVQVNGNDLDEADQMLFSHSGIQAKPMMLEPNELYEKPRPKAGWFEVTIGKDVPPGVYEARVVGRYGISNPRAFAVSTRTEVWKDGKPNSREKAMDVQLDTTISAKMGNQSIDYYRVELQKGQRVVFDCWGRRLDSRINAAMKLYGPSGELLREVRDTVRGDPVITIVAPRTGEYIVAVHDFVYRGGSEYYYRLTIETRPHIDFVYPPVGKAGTKQKYTVYGRNLPGGTPTGERVYGSELEEQTVEITLPNGDKNVHELPFSPALPPRSGLLSGKLFRLKGQGGGSNAVLVQYADAPVVLEEESQQSGREFAQQVETPCEFVGRLYPRHDIDWVAFEAKKGESYWISVIGNRLGTYADPTLMVERVTTDKDGNEQVKRIATVDDEDGGSASLIRTDSADPSYTLTANADALYRIRIKDLYGNPTADPRLVYRLIIQTKKPDFDVMAFVEPERDNRNRLSPRAAVMRRGGTIAVKLNLVRRRGFRGRVEVIAQGLPNGVATDGAVFEGGVETGWIVFTADENAKFWAGPIRLIAKAEVNGKQVSRTVRVATLVWGTDRNGNGGVARMGRELALAVIDAEQAPVFIEAGNGKELATAHGGKLDIPVKVNAREKLKGNLKVEAVNLHKNLNFNSSNIKGNGKLQLEVRGNDVPVGVYTFYLRGESKFSYKRNQDAVKWAQQLQKKAGELVKQRKQAEDEAKQARDKANQEADDAENQLKQARQKADEAKKKADEAAKRVKDLEKKLADAKKAAAADKDDKGKAEAVKKTQAELDEAKKQSQQAADALKKAQVAVSDAEKKHEAAQKTKQEAEEKFQQAEAARKKAEQLKKQADNDAKNIKKRNNPKGSDVTFRAVSTPVRLRIARHPVKVTVKSPQGKLKQGEETQFPVMVERLFGFDDKIDIDVDLSGVRDVKVQQKDIDKGKDQAAIKLTAGKNATPGKHEGTVRLRFRLGRVSHDIREKFTFEIHEVKEKKQKK